jgi:hypothetical protein
MRVMVAAGIAASATVAVVAIASSTGRETRPPRHSGSSPASSSAPESADGCSGAEVRALVVRFLGALNRGDAPLLRRVLPTSADFQWFTIDDPDRRLRAGAYSPRGVLSYVVRRHRVGERLRLVLFAFNGNNAAYGHFEYRLVRSASDLGPTRYEGKGAALCTEKPATIATWAMGRPNR